jgi:Ca2+-binding RTX toxin-like protein
MGIKKSGSRNIDALLGRQYWNGVGKPVTLTYSIDTTGKDGLEAMHIRMIQEALERWENVANITFKYVRKGGSIRFSGEDGTVGNASYKYAWKWYKPGSWNTKKLDHVDVTLGRDSETGLGNRFLQVAIHEIGHALGLKHPGNYNGDDRKGYGDFLHYRQDNKTNTVMSYNHGRGGGHLVTPMPYDIRAIQYLYGARIFNEGNSTYTFDSVDSYRYINDKGYHYEGGNGNRVRLTLWDSDGIDTLDFSRLSGSEYRIDINEGGIITLKSAYNSSSYKPVNNSENTSGLEYFTSPYGTSIAYGTKIENVIGSSSNDYILGNGLRNRLEGRLGNDSLDGGTGNDSLYGGSGNDWLDGGKSKSFKFFGAVFHTRSSGNDYLDGGSGNDSLYGREGNDTLKGGDGNDTLYGNSDSDQLSGGSGNDALYGGIGNDTIWADGGHDLVYGGDGHDRLAGWSGNDTIRGESGNDTIWADDGNDRVYGGSGNDTIWGESDNSNLNRRYVGGNDSLYGGSGNDKIYGGKGNDYLNGGTGNDTLYGDDGDDYLQGYSGNDNLIGRSGNDSLHGYSGNDKLSGGSGNDFLRGWSGSDSLHGDFGNDTLKGDSGNDTLYGGQHLSTIYSWYQTYKSLPLGILDYGNDDLNGGSGHDILYGGLGSDILNGSSGDDILHAGYGPDLYRFGVYDYSKNTLLGGSGHDKLYGDLGQDDLSGGSGNDSLYGSSGNDILKGDTGNDILKGDAGADTLNGGSDNDSLYGGSNNDLLRGDAGNDFLNGESGADTLIGGIGNDIYIIDSQGDTVLEYANQGTDKVESSISYTLGNQLEKLTLKGSRSINGYGNDLNNTIQGNSAHNTLDGRAGNDQLYGAGGSDNLNGGSGNDYLVGGSYNSDSLLSIYLSLLNAFPSYYNPLSYFTAYLDHNRDYLSGGDGHDVIEGGSGGDILWGGKGNDQLHGDWWTNLFPFPQFAKGTNLLYGEEGDDNLVSGYSGNDQLHGGEGNDRLTGLNGNNLLDGGTGDDILQGGFGADKFRFNSQWEGLDTITDFSRIQGDKIEVLASGFAGVFTRGLLNSSQFVLGSSAADGSDRFIFDNASKTLYFDSDGTGAAGQTQIATFSNGVTLSHSDIVVV